ncbi:hypothetical protein [Butyrivibrio sp. WCE2006]|uniref:hypothetical protein n=1 Tax=Butyrivibrio sp. WCE2006 TaxID=1410611 RepID=UPI0005D2994D|nr:hypothetical protein [Butyrivibrio sp. WCE2006]
MRTVALRFSDNIAPECGTIKAHELVISKYDEVWYGKFGNTLSGKIINEILNNDDPKILLIQSGTSNRYWAHVKSISKEMPDLEKVPSYYHHEKGRIKTWFNVIKFEKADKNVMSKCTVASSGTILTRASMHSMSPYFIIDYEE